MKERNIEFFETYERSAARTAPDLPIDQMIVNGVMGLNGESGECIDIVKKHHFQGHDLDKEKLIDELGDVMWYIALTARGLGVTMQEIATKNIKKLLARYPDGFDSEKSINR